MIYHDTYRRAKFKNKLIRNFNFVNFKLSVSLKTQGGVSRSFYILKTKAILNTNFRVYLPPFSRLIGLIIEDTSLKGDIDGNLWSATFTGF